MLTLFVGMSYYLPTELITDRNAWYGICIMAEMFVLTMAFFLSVAASLPVLGICVMLIVGHLLNWNHASGPVYYIIANYLEYLEIVCCIIFAPITLDFIKTRIRHAFSRSN